MTPAVELAALVAVLRAAGMRKAAIAAAVGVAPQSMSRFLGQARHDAGEDVPAPRRRPPSASVMAALRMLAEKHAPRATVTT